MVQISRLYSPNEKYADGWVHAIGIIASLVGAGVLTALAAVFLPINLTLAVVVYVVTMVALFVASASYHMIRIPRLRDLFRRLDHAAIYFKIAGTYTPIALIKLSGLVGYALLGGVWAIALFGAIAKILWPDHLLRTSYVLYLAAGWAGLFALDALTTALSPTVLTLLLIGGVLYTVGVIFHLWERLPYHIAIWHGLVLVASCCHFTAMVMVVAS